MITLHLGVADIAYVQDEAHVQDAPKRPRKKGARPRRTGGSRVSTTGDVAQILEAKYHILEIFAETRKDDLAAALVSSYQGALESLLMGAPATLDPAGVATSKIEAMMKDWISSGAMEKLGYPGVPTKAALEGRSSRLKSKRGSRRVSFRDTGLMAASYKSWIEGA